MRGRSQTKNPGTGKVLVGTRLIVKLTAAPLPRGSLWDGQVSGFWSNRGNSWCLQRYLYFKQPEGITSTTARLEHDATSDSALIQTAYLSDGPLCRQYNISVVMISGVNNAHFTTLKLLV